MKVVKGGYFPYLRLGKMNELLRAIPLQLVSQVNEFSAQKLAETVKVGPTTASNFIATLKSLGFVKGSRRFRFTAEGDSYAIFIKNQAAGAAAEEEAKKVLRQQVEKIEYLQAFKKMLDEKRRLTIFEIGEQIVLRYEKKWKSPLTLKTYGAGVASVLDFAGFGFYRRGLLSLVKKEVESRAMPVPYLSAEKMFKILNLLSPSGADILFLSQNLKTQERRLSQELACCRTLGFVKHPSRNFYSLTREGKAIISRFKSEGERRAEFRRRLLASPYKRGATQLPRGEKITVETVGNLLETVYQKRWSDLTKKTYAKKFLNWLKFAGIVTKLEGEKGYKVSRT